jgi:hypothetical protein
MSQFKVKFRRTVLRRSGVTVQVLAFAAYDKGFIWDEDVMHLLSKALVYEKQWHHAGRHTHRFAAYPLALEVTTVSKEWEDRTVCRESFELGMRLNRRVRRAEAKVREWFAAQGLL